jgi:hypothetical protein
MCRRKPQRWPNNSLIRARPYVEGSANVTYSKQTAVQKALRGITTAQSLNTDQPSSGQDTRLTTDQDNTSPAPSQIVSETVVLCQRRMRHPRATPESANSLVMCGCIQPSPSSNWYGVLSRYGYLASTYGHVFANHSNCCRRLRSIEREARVGGGRAGTIRGLIGAGDHLASLS